MQKVTDECFDNIIYVSHPYGGLKENEEKVAAICAAIMEKHPNSIVASPVHFGAWAYGKTPYEIGISYCLWLLEKSDVMWVYGDWENSKGCNIEIEYCKEHGIPFEIKGEIE